MLLGDLIIWYYENLAGIKADAENPAFKHIVMKPQVLGDLTYVTASYNSIHGEIKSGWKLEDGKFYWDVSIPANTTATVYVPTLNKEDVKEGNRLASNSNNVSFIGWDDNWAVFEIESGDYSFSSHGVKMSITEPYLSTPVIAPQDSTTMLGDTIIATMMCKNNGAIIRYTLDGSEPDNSSPIYDEPLEISNNTMVKAQAFMDGYNPSIQSKVVYDFVDQNQNGIVWNLYEGAFIKLPNFDKLKSNMNGRVFQFGLDKIDVKTNSFALQFDSFIQIDKDGEYLFYISSNDGSKLYIDDKLVVDNDGEHGPKQLSGTIYLKKGGHSIRVEYFQSGGSKTLSVYFSSDEINYQPILGSLLYISNN
ncbi:MAG: chitobiase/beta-hexosaminidase C-terminal domain-containing protein, partial [Candidatus Heimdallarchaeota archaeon]|nr:chitobiase/beta-hexosaminidase C-terminal domain-containing protein [Candidatus Heimdallarchaeota archaeon]